VLTRDRPNVINNTFIAVDSAYPGKGLIFGSDLRRGRPSGDVQADDLALHLGLGPIEIRILLALFDALDRGVDRIPAQFFSIGRKRFRTAVAARVDIGAVSSSKRAGHIPPAGPNAAGEVCEPENPRPSPSPCPDESVLSHADADGGSES